ncbi:metalloprotease TIKI2-like [Suncus etruscus]|uniref:metalloprotease TIKI2-like n=1 Tax=Suncus etruscus TaxID=109475 RepID=UPI0021105CCE|nr:metalloprotease TIKI2-like [Suncus etruscus]
MPLQAPHTSLSLALTTACEAAAGMFAQTQEENPEVFERHILGQTPPGPSSLGGQQDGQPSPEPLQGRSGRQVGEPDPITPFPLVDTPRTLATDWPTLPFASLTPSKPRVFGGLPHLWVSALLQAGKPWAEQTSLGVFGRRLPPTLARAERVGAAPGLRDVRREADTGEVLFALNQTLLQHESVRAGSLQAPYTTEDLIKHYNCGDLNAVIFNHDTSQLPNFINTTLPPHEQVTAQEIDSYFRQELIYKRNERMGRRVLALLQENQDKICFFAFGAGHFLGNNTVIDVLRQGGLEVEHTPAGQTVHSPAAQSPAPTPKEISASPAPVTLAAVEPAAPSATPTTPPEEEDPALSPHLLLPDSLSQLEEFGRQKKWHKRQNKHPRPRQFNDLWVRLEDSTTGSPPPMPLQLTHSPGTAEPPLQLPNQFQHQESSGPAGSSTQGSQPALGLLPACAASLLLCTLRPS